MAEPQSVAEKALKKISAQLECGVCLDTYTNPKLLPCFHVFCKQCLERLVVQDRDGLRLRCPNCRQSTLLPPNGISGLQSAFHINNLFEIQDALTKARESQKTQCEKCKKATATGYCRDCGKFVCDKCIELHQMWEELTTHKIATLADIQADATNLTPPKKKVTYCQKHPDSVLKIYCETCGVLICNDCTVRLHQGHQYDLVTDTFPKHREEIVTSLKPVKQHLAAVDQALVTLDTRSKTITDQRMAIEADVHKQIDHLQQTLEERRTELIAQLDQVTQQKLKGLGAQRDQVEFLHTQLSSCVEYVEGSLRTGTKGEILEMKTPVLKQIEQITAGFNPDALTPKEMANVYFVTKSAADFKQVCTEYAQVVGHSADPATSHASGDGLKTATVGEQAIVTVHAVDKDGRGCHELVNNLTAELVCCRDGARTEGKVEREGKSNYRVKYQPATRGKHQLYVRINGRDIRGSPHSLIARLPIHSLGKPVTTIGGLKEPWGVAINSKGHIIVAEFGGNCISIFTTEGKKILSFGQRGSEKGQFSSPTGVCAGKDDNIFIVDYGNDRIQKFTSTGQFIKSVGLQGNSQLQFQNPVGIGFNGKLYVCDQSNQRIQVLDEELTFSTSFGSRRGAGDGEFYNNQYIASDSTGNVYVTEYANHRVQVFTPEGQFLRKFGRQGSGAGQLNCPIGIAIDSSNTVYVSDSGNYRISMFTTEGKFLGSFGSCGTAEGQLRRPIGVAVNENGFILVADSRNNHIQIF